MEPRKFFITGLSVLILGLALSGIGLFLSGWLQYQSGYAYSYTVTMFGAYLVFIGGLFTAVGHMTEHLSRKVS